MNKKLFTLGCMLIGATIANAQAPQKAAVYPVKTIQEIQFVSPQDLQAGNDASSIGATDTVRVRGVVIMDANTSTLVGGKQIWIQTNDGSPFSGLDIYQNFPGTGVSGDAGTGILSLVAGDSVEITGRVEEFQGETEFIPINTSPATPIQLLDAGKVVKSKLILASELNDPSRNNILTTGEQYEGMYVELQNMTVSSVDYFSNGARVSFNITDNSGNKVNVSDRFLAMKIVASGGSFYPPNVGDKITSIKGIIIHSKNNRGYEIHPFQLSDLVFGASAPAITNITRSKVVPTSNDDIVITANINDVDGVSSAKLFYAVGASNVNYIEVPMTNVNTTYSATIPKQAEGSFIKYFIEAKDGSVDLLTSRIPNVPAEEPKFFVVRDNGLNISDLQYTPYATGNSGYVDQTVTVTGVVTASSTDLGYVFIQEEGVLSWGAIQVTGNAALSTVTLGQKLTVTGVVKESFGFTRLESVTGVQVVGTGVITPVVVEPDSFRTYSATGNELYESMLVKFAPASGSLYVVDQNADDPSNFAEYRVGKDKLDGGAGSRVLAGRQNSSTISSLNVSYVMDSLWIPNPGVPLIVVHEGDSMTSLTGIMYYGFNNMKILPRNNADFENMSAGHVGITSSHVNKGRVVAYPNPAVEDINFDFILPVDAKNICIRVYDILGKQVAVKNLPAVSGTVAFETANLTNGTYIYTVVSENAGVLNTGRFVVTK
jgi:hypothetical protein